MFKDNRFTIRLTDAERTALFKVAEVFGMSPSEFLRDQLRTEARRLNYWPPTDKGVSQ